MMTVSALRHGVARPTSAAAISRFSRHCCATTRLYAPTRYPVTSNTPAAFLRYRNFTTTHIRRSDEDRKSRPNIDRDVTEEELDDFDKRVAENKTKQMRTPWMRQGSDEPPAKRERSAGAMTKGKLLTTPSRLLKLILPLTTRDVNSDRKDAEPLALLVHPQQPLSYLERLIQAELPTIKDEKGNEKIPGIHFRAQDVGSDEGEAGEERTAAEQDRLEQRGGPGEGGVEVYSGRGREMDDEEASVGPLVRWSKSTEIGDFIRDAARGREFAVEVEGAPREIRVGVPSFGDRTYYLRMRLRKKADQIQSMAKVKQECDKIAHRHAQYIAYAGFGGMIGWGAVVAYLTFLTDLGWDFMEPVTYLVGLVGFLGGYAWFLSNRREASYQSAMNLTVSRRQQKLYEARGFDLQRWQQLVDEGNLLRKDIMHIAAEYDVEWTERMDAKDESVVKALKEERHKQKKKKREQDDEEEDDDDDDNDDDEDDHKEHRNGKKDSKK